MLCQQSSVNAIYWSMVRLCACMRGRLAQCGRIDRVRFVVVWLVVYSDRPFRQLRIVLPNLTSSHSGNEKIFHLIKAFPPLEPLLTKLILDKMTILPKKKLNKSSANNEDDRDNDHVAERFNYGHASSSGKTKQRSPTHCLWSSSESKRPSPAITEGADRKGLPPPSSKRCRNRNNRDSSGKPRSFIGLNKATLAKNTSLPSSSRDLTTTDDLAIPSGSELSALHHSSLAGAEQQTIHQEDASGYNSGDEYQHASTSASTAVNNIDWDEKERMFYHKIKDKGFIIKEMCEDGACLFRAVGMIAMLRCLNRFPFILFSPSADQVYGDQEMHSSVRKQCMDYMVRHVTF